MCLCALLLAKELWDVINCSELESLFVQGMRWQREWLILAFL